MKLPIVVLFLIASSSVCSEGTLYKIEYDFAGHGDDWYGQTGNTDIQQDFAPLTNIITQQGDDFCYGYQPSIVNFNQAPELSRTQNMHSSYEFQFTGGTLCITGTPPTPKPDLIFLNGFEN